MCSYAMSREITPHLCGLRKQLGELERRGKVTLTGYVSALIPTDCGVQ